MTKSVVGRYLGLLSALLVVACGSSDSSSSASEGSTDDYPPPPAPKPLEWSPCTEPELQKLQGECATLGVPMDYRHPDGTEIDVAVARLPATDPGRKIGSLLYRPSGPGNVGRTDLPRLQGVLTSNGPSDLLARFDVVTFDPRGVTANAVVDCGGLPGYGELDWTPDDQVERDALDGSMREVVAACEKGTGPLLDFVDTYSIARDLDQLRRAVGEEKTTYLGLSYGTVLGTAYADLFPERVRAMTLDAGIEPNLDGARWARDRAKNWNRAFEDVADECDRTPDCAARFDGGLRGAYDRALEQLKAAPLLDAETGEPLNDVVFEWLVGDQLERLPDSASTFEFYVENVLQAVPTGTNSFVGDWLGYLRRNVELSVATLCYDLGFPDPATLYDELIPELTSISPRFGLADVPWLLPCSYWQTPRQQHAAPRAHGAAPILVIGATGDGALPYAWSQDLASGFESGVLLTYQGVSHPSIPISQCVLDAASAYLVDLTLPPPGTVCPTP